MSTSQTNDLDNLSIIAGDTSERHGVICIWQADIDIDKGNKGFKLTMCRLFGTIMPFIAFILQNLNVSCGAFALVTL